MTIPNAPASTLAEKILSLIAQEKEGSKDAFLEERALGDVITALSKRYDKEAVSSPLLEAVTDRYIGAQLGPQWHGLLRLHAFMKASDATVEAPHNFEHADRYGVAFADEGDFKTMAFQTQSLTYLVALERRDVFIEKDASYEQVEAWKTHLRICTDSRYSNNFCLAPFSGLTWMNDKADWEANDYFRYKDGRDRGFLCSIEPDWFEAGKYTSKDSLRFGAAYSYLTGISYDLMSHVSCLPKNSEHEDHRPGGVTPDSDQHSPALRNRRGAGF